MTGDEIMARMLQAAFDPLADGDEQARQLGELNKAAEQVEKSERARQAAIVKAALANPAGERFLAWLRARTIEAPMPAAQLAARTAEEYALIGARRDGAAQLYHTIVEAMAEIEPTTEEQS